MSKEEKDSIGELRDVMSTMLQEQLKTNLILNGDPSVGLKGLGSRIQDLESDVKKLNEFVTQIIYLRTHARWLFYLITGMVSTSLYLFLKIEDIKAGWKNLF